MGLQEKKFYTNGAGLEEFCSAVSAVSIDVILERIIMTLY
jgi:hypothetical protein